MDTQEGQVYIIGGGVAGIATAYRIALRAEEAGHSPPGITVIDRNPEVAQGVSQAYGGFLTANSYKTVDFASPEEARARLATPYVPDAQRPPSTPAGWAVSPRPTPAERRWIDAAAENAGHDAAQREADEITYHRFCLSSIRQWRDFCTENPDFAEACSFRYGSNAAGDDGILKIFTPGTDFSRFAKEKAFLGKVGGDAANSRELPPSEAAARCDAAHAAYGEEALYATQHGGNINGQVFCRKMLDHLREKGCDITFLGEQEVTEVRYGGNSGAIQGLTLAGADGRERKVGGFADRYVFATGADQSVWGKLGYGSSPVMGVAGTSLTVPFDPDISATPLKFVDRHGGPVMIPLRDGDGKPCMRMGGYTAFSGEAQVDTHQDFARDFLQRQFDLFATLYPQQAQHFVENELGGDLGNLPHYAGSWAGTRPVTPDNHAIVGQLPGPGGDGCPNGFIVTGLGASGLLAMGAADMVAQLMDGASRDGIALPGLERGEARQVARMTDLARLEPFREPLPQQRGMAM